MPDDPIQLDDQGHWLDLAGFGRDAWNTWAEKELEKPFSQRKTVNLENVKIKHSDFSGFKFPSYVNFSSAEFQCHAFFSQAHFFWNVSFHGSQFAHGATRSEEHT